MQLPKFPKFKLPKWNFNFKLPEFLRPQHSFYSIWKKFVRLIPPESRSMIKSYQHFIVLGNEKTGKTDLIQGLIEQSQDLYPFDTTYTAAPEIQFYLGPRQVVQEIAFSTLENRAIKVRKHVIKLWKKLYARRDPIVIIAYNCCSDEEQNLRELNKLAQLVAGKISLLSEIRKKPLKIRIALTHLDKITGYLEFARFLKQQNITFNINLSSNFESNTLASTLKKFSEDHLSLILTSVAEEDYIKILTFFKEMPQHFSNVEEFLRALVSRVSFKSSIELDMLSFTSNQETSTSFNPFQWVKLPSTAIFFRYPMLKHQLASAFLFLFTSSLLLNSYFQVRNELFYTQKGVELLDLLQFSTFQEKVVPKLDQCTNHKMSVNLFSYLKPCFFGKQLNVFKTHLANRVRKHIIEREFRKAVLENKAEFKYIYFLGLMNATRNNHLGKFIIKNSSQWANALNIEEGLIRIYVNDCQNLENSSSIPLTKVNPFLPLTSLKPWLSFLKKFQEISLQPIFVEHNFEEIIKDTDKLLTAINRLRSDTIVFAIATLLEEEIAKEKNNENIQTIRWVGENIDALENFLLFIKKASVASPDINGMNVSQFFVQIKEIAAISEMENQSYNFALLNHSFSFESSDWVKLVVAHNVERAIQEYIVTNHDTSGSIFFNNTSETPEPLFPQFSGPFPFFKTKFTIPGRYSRADYEKKVRSTAEKLSVLVESLPINPEEKKRFTNFLMQESVSYIKKYQDKYVKLFDTCDIQMVSLDQLKKILVDLLKPTSSFHDFLHTVQHHTSACGEPILSLKNLDELNEFKFLNTILYQQDGQAPIDEYQKVIEQILNEMQTNSIAVNKEFEFLAPHLTPAAKISLHILQNDPASYLNKVKQSLNNIGVPERFHGPFNKPILQLYKIGLNELKSSIEYLWTSQLYPKVESAFSKFPFDLKGKVPITFEETKKIFSPNGEFFKTLNQVVSACGYQRDGKWYPLDPQNFHLDENLCNQLHRISCIANALWDSDGNPQPIRLRIKSVPFTNMLEANPVPVLSYFIFGSDSLHNFNQDPSWQTVKVEWWKTDSSTIGMELVNKLTNGKSYRNIQKVNTLWSFFELLKAGKQETANVWSWELPNHDGSDTRKVSLYFETNPQEILQWNLR